MDSSSRRTALTALAGDRCYNANHPGRWWGHPKTHCIECLTAFVDREMQTALKTATRDAVRAFGERVAKQMCVLCAENDPVIGARPWVGKPQFLHLVDGEVHVCEASLVWELLGRDKT